MTLKTKINHLETMYDVERKSTLTFPDRAEFRNEISGVERPSSFSSMLDAMKEFDVPIHRAICTVMGASYLTVDELRGMARMARDAKIEVIITPGPRASWDVGRQIATPEGALSGLRIRGNNGLRMLIADVIRSSDAGFRGFLVTDEGVLWLLSKLRKDGTLSKRTVFKVSIFAGHANPAGAHVLEMLGANTFNPVADLSVAQISSIRQAISIPIDIHVMLADSFGGFNRMWEAGNLISVASPCYLKIEPGATLCIAGGTYKPWTDEKTLAVSVREKVKYASIIREIVSKSHPRLRLSKQGASDLSIPEV